MSDVEFWVWGEATTHRTSPWEAGFTNPLSGMVAPYRLYNADTSYKVKVTINKKRGPLKRRTVYIKKEW